ncbi:SRPBCC domain-containing protein [Bradyrhizobium sp. AS23.2]|uniref:SRPBCC domain-containing protein n=1 Tax=Bradyrhizobium sp. AS23.2 TaxID=1680155 RepID=UPI00093F9B8D|nr:SRPBCC domain-containing protein [Bradyrhizobium sp. AS23.2]
MHTQASVQSVADTARGIVLATVEIAARPEHVFRALTEPDQVVRWWGSDEAYRITNWQMEIGVGGRWRSEGRNADGTSFCARGELLRVDRPTALSMSWMSDWDGGQTSVVHYALEGTTRTTRLTLCHEELVDRPDACRAYAEGWRLVLGWLQQYLAPQSTEASFLLRLNPPRPNFSGDMSSEEAALMKLHFGYWATLLKAGTAIAYGPVADPGGTWGVAIVRAAEMDAAWALTDQDPVVGSGRGVRYEIFAMPQLMRGE